MNNLLRVVTWKWNGRDSNPRPVDRESNALTIRPTPDLCHTILNIKYEIMLQTVTKELKIKC